MDIKYDTTADAMYFKVSAGAVSRTIEMNDRLVVDVDKKGNIIGIEILDVSSQQNLIQSLKKNQARGVPIEIIKSLSVAA